MAIRPTGDLFKAFTFDGESSRTHGAYISGFATFNAPERDVEMIDIPGRNGSLALDHGRFSNIEVRYPAGLYGDTESDFAEAASSLRNWLCSKRGYVRLEDEYNPDEYRLAVYKSGLELDMVDLKAGECTLAFDCKPQRFLKTGETATTVNSGSTVTNPTKFDAQPLLTATGYGTISIGGKKITIAQAQAYGLTDIYRLTVYQSQKVRSVGIYSAANRYNSGDTISFEIEWQFLTQRTSLGVTAQGNVVSVSNESGSGTTAWTTPSLGATVKWAGTFTAGTSQNITHSSDLDIRYNVGAWIHSNDTLTLSAYYNGGNVIQFTYAMTYNGDQETAWSPEFTAKSVTVDSTYTPTQAINIDLEIGEAYSKVGTEIISRNAEVSIPPQLPTLPPGATTVTFDGTISQLKITPRWWIV